MRHLPRTSARLCCVRYIGEYPSFCEHGKPDRRMTSGSCTNRPITRCHLPDIPKRCQMPPDAARTLPDRNLAITLLTRRTSPVMTHLRHRLPDAARRSPAAVDHNFTGCLANKAHFSRLDLWGTLGWVRTRAQNLRNGFSTRRSSPGDVAAGSVCLCAAASSSLSSGPKRKNPQSESRFAGFGPGAFIPLTFLFYHNKKNKSRTLFR